MDSRQLRKFLAVAQYGSYTRGAQSLNISQPALSRAVKMLEDELGTPLFTRGGHGVTLTRAGHVVYDRALSLFQQLDDIRDDVRRGGDGPAGTIVFAIPAPSSQILVPPLIARFGGLFPRVNFKITRGNSAEIYEHLIKGEIDVGCVHHAQPHKNVEIVPLVQEEMQLIGPGDRNELGRDHALFQDLNHLPLIVSGRPSPLRQWLDGIAIANGVTPNVKWEVDDPVVLRMLISQGMGYGLAVRGAGLADIAAGRIRVYPFRPAAPWPLSLIRSRRAGRPPDHETFFNMVRDIAATLVADGTWPALPDAAGGPFAMVGDQDLPDDGEDADGRDTGR